MQSEGLGALIFGATGAIGTVLNFFIFRNLFFSCSDLLAGAKCTSWFANRSRSGSLPKERKNLWLSSSTIWTTISNSLTTTTSISVQFFALWDARSSMEKKCSGKLTRRFLSWQQISPSKTVQFFLVRHQKLSTTVIEGRRSNFLLSVLEGQRRS